jgi:hypothetical protein
MKRGQPYITVIEVIDGRGSLRAVMSERLSTFQVTGMYRHHFLTSKPSGEDALDENG